MKVEPIKTYDGQFWGYRYACYCPVGSHAVRVGDPHPNKPDWSFNNDTQNPTFSPSIKAQYGHDLTCRCHHYIQNGQIQFLSDSTHKYAGQILPMLDIA